MDREIPISFLMLLYFIRIFPFIVLGISITLIINRYAKKLWLAPLIINAAALITFFLTTKLNKEIGDLESAMIFTYAYMPTLFTSILTNFIVFVIRKIKKNKER